MKIIKDKFIDVFIKNNNGELELYSNKESENYDYFFDCTNKKVYSKNDKKPELTTMDRVIIGTFRR